ncbi:MAG: type II secretion system F family protein, partial [Planctomycetes bacterium]|nr:type II secretion system F family protein [Planctomycetota bacterium]
MPASPLLILVPPGLIVAGVALLWLRSALRPSGVSPFDHPGLRFLSAFGWSVLVIGILSTVAVATHVYAVFAVLVTLVVLIAAVRHYYGAERQTLLWILMTAAERGIPLREAAQAFALERQDLVGRRAELLADYLDAGLPLALALQRSGHHLPRHVQLAVEVGERTGTLGSALRQVVGMTDELENASRSLLERFFYIVFLLIFTSVMLGFLMLKIMPVFQQLFGGLDLEMPAATRWLLQFSRPVERGGPLVLLPVLVLVIVIGVALRHYLAHSARDITLVRGLWRRADCAMVLRWLSIAVEQGRSIADSLRLMAGFVSHRWLRRRLEKAAQRIEGGEPWGDSLKRCGLARTS